MSCLFCRIVAGEIAAQKVYEDEQVLAFRDINPQAPVHVLVIPKTHVASIARLSDGDGAWVPHLLLKLGEVARTLGVEDGGYRVVTNHGEQAGQTVDHLHFHVLGGRPFAWPPG